MKRGMVILLILLLCGCQQQGTWLPFETLSLLEAEHPELDFGLAEHDGQRTIRDFALNREGNLLLLELSAQVYEYSAKGELLATYDFGFAEKGLTAYLMTVDQSGNFYFVDGHNCLIIRANKKGILGTAALGDKAIIKEPGLIKAISALDENLLAITAISPSDYLTYTYEVDVSGEEAVCLASNGGTVLGNGYSYENILLLNENGGVTDSTKVTIYKNGQVENEFEVRRPNNFVVGLRILGISAEDTYFANLSEYLPGDIFQERLVVLNRQGEIIAMGKGVLKSDDLIRGYQGNSYVLRFETDGLTVFPFQKLF